MITHCPVKDVASISVAIIPVFTSS
jgi:hypothetical protein